MGRLKQQKRLDWNIAPANAWCRPMSRSIDDLAGYIRSQRERYDRALDADLSRLRTEYGSLIVGEAIRPRLHAIFMENGYRNNLTHHGNVASKPIRFSMDRMISRNLSA
jgi:hypothetical protein